MTDALPGDAPRPFVLLDGVSAAEPDHLTAWRRFGSAPMWQGLEAAAQAAALHQRFLAGFSCHAFLLSVDECRFPTDALDGLMVFRAVLLGRSLRQRIGWMFVRRALSLCRKRGVRRKRIKAFSEWNVGKRLFRHGRFPSASGWLLMTIPLEGICWNLDTGGFFNG